MKNKVYFIGAGPGEPGLITARGLEILRQADVVIYDYLVNKKILQEAKPGAELICCDKLGKNRHSDGFIIHQEKINCLVVKKAREDKKVIRLKNGDPAIFSRLSQELEFLIKNKVGFEVVPGVTAASGASLFSGIPLTDRRFASDVVFVTGHEGADKKGSLIDWAAISKIGTIVLYMAIENLSKIAKNLLDAGKPADTPCAIIQDATLLTQRILTGNLNNIAVKAKAQNIMPPAIIIIGEAVSLTKQFNWLKKSKKALFTGLSNERFFEDKIYFHLPLIKIEPLPDYCEFDNYLKKIKSFDWIVFLSRFGVEYFFKRLKAIGRDSRALYGIKIAAIGSSTANRLLDFSIIADLVAKKESSDGVIEEFKKLDIKNKKIFMPRSDISDKGLAERFEGLGADVSFSFAYKNVAPSDLPDLKLDFFDEIIFTSPSGVRNFAKRYGKITRKIKISCIGDVTEREVKRIGLIAKVYSL